ncbi:condensation domain-containing protein [Streptomyces sp. NBC_00564]|uniref:condensation domain-containing protein n=1 Tax=Streptomyces sp. NBC_00564 TaxID=2903663 RepID=UPI00352D4CCA|nr:condensation domain-containing protein [Streptomyces sp. NBC_00564]
MTGQSTTATGGPTVWPLSVTQRGRILRDRSRGATSYNMHVAWDVEGRIDASRLERRLALVASRHPMLRARIVASAFTQVLEERVPVPLRVETGLTDAAADARLRAHETSAFDRSRAPLWECLLLDLRSGRKRLALTLDHMICDGHSLDQLIGELASGVEPDGPCGASYGDFVARERARYGPGTDDMMAYWREHLAGTAPDRGVSLPFCSRQDAPLSGRIEQRSAALSREEAERVRQLRSQQGVTPFLYFLAAVLAGLSRLSGRPDITVRLPVHGRSPEFASTVGWIANLVRFRLPNAAHPDFHQVVEDVRHTWAKQLAHQSAPYDVVRDRLTQSPPGPTRPAVVTVALLTAPTVLEALGARLLPRPPTGAIGLGDEAGLYLSFTETADGAVLGCRYDPARYATDEVDLVLRAVRLLLTGSGPPRGEARHAYTGFPEPRRDGLGSAPLHRR